MGGILKGTVSHRRGPRNVLGHRSDRSGSWSPVPSRLFRWYRCEERVGVVAGGKNAVR